MLREQHVIVLMVVILIVMECYHEDVIFLTTSWYFV